MEPETKWTGTRIGVEIIGWTGAILLLIGYYLIQTHKVEHDNNTYMLLNIIGAFLLMLNTLYHRAYPSVLTNGVWVIIGLIVAVRLWYGRGDPKFNLE